MVLFIIFIVIVGLILLCGIKIVPQASAWIIETFGRYSGTLHAGAHFVFPVVSKVAKKVSIREQVADFEPQPVITKDNVTVMVDSVVYLKIFDPKLYYYGVERPIAAVENLCATTMRNIFGSMTLDETLTSRDLINGQITALLDEATDQWGIKVNRVEVKNIQPPQTIREAMEKQMKAEREKRQAILRADGERQAEVTRAQGEKEAAILRADAVKEQRIREAEGEAQALLAIQKARAQAIRLINEAKPSQEYIALRSMEASENMADGRATKIIVPSDIQNLAATVAAFTGIASKNNPPEKKEDGQPNPQQPPRKERHHNDT